MRIWIINHYAVPPSTVGITRHYHFARQLIARGHEVILIAANYNHFTQSHHPDFLTSEVPIIWIPTPAYNGNTIYRLLNHIIFSFRLLKQKYLPCKNLPDIIIGSSPHLFAALSAQLLAKKLKRPFTLEIRDIWPETLIDTGKFSAKHPLIKIMKWIEQHLYRQTKKIISVLPGANEYLTQYGFKKKHILYLPNAIEANSIPNPVLPANRQFTVMYAGSHGFANDLETVIYAAKMLETRYKLVNIQICLIGEGPEKVRLQQLAKENNITILTFLPAIPKKEIYSTLKSANVFLMLLKNLPVFRFGISPNKLFDYMAMSRPVIFAVNTRYNPIAEAKAGITIPPSDPENLAAAIHQLYLLPKIELEKMGIRAREFILKHHNISHLTDQLERFLVEMVDNSSLSEEGRMRESNVDD